MSAQTDYQALSLWVVASAYFTVAAATEIGQHRCRRARKRHCIQVEILSKTVISETIVSLTRSLVIDRLIAGSGVGIKYAFSG